MSRGKRKSTIKTWNVEGYCELETGIVEFTGFIKGVSIDQAWYNIITDIKLKFNINYWINPIIVEYKVTKDYNECNFKVAILKYGEIKPKDKLDNRLHEGYLKKVANGFYANPKLDKNEIDKVNEILNIERENIERENSRLFVLDDLRFIKSNLDTKDIFNKEMLEELKYRISMHKDIIKDYTFSTEGLMDMDTSYKKIKELCSSNIVKLQDLGREDLILLNKDIHIEASNCMDIITNIIDRWFIGDMKF